VKVATIAIALGFAAACTVADDPEAPPVDEYVAEKAPSPGTWLGSGIVDPNAKSYLYAPSVMYDETEGLWKFWGCGGVKGDFVVYKEATTLDGLGKAPWQHALKPLYDGAFDHGHTCDPNVIRVGGDYYLYYGGLNELQPPNLETTRIGVAISKDGGRTFTRLHGGKPIVDITTFAPGSYGVGQPAVTRGADGWFYMVYSHLDGTSSLLKVIKSQQPSFAKWTPVRTIVPPAFSVDLAFEPSRNRFDLVGQVSTPGHGARIVVLHFDANWKDAGQTIFDGDGGFRFGEGAAIVRDSQGRIARTFEKGAPYVTFVAATHGTRKGLPTWITGPTRYVRYASALVDKFAVDGWDLGVYNPFGTDGNLYLRRGHRSGTFADDTAYHWGASPPAKVLSGDFDGDGIWDVALYNPHGTDGSFFIRYGDGKGGFGRQTVWKWGVYPAAQPFAGDFDGDGKFDVGLYNPHGTDGKFYIQYGDGKGRFGRQTVWKWGVFPSAKVFAGDFDGDGKFDVGLYNPHGTDGSFYIQYGDGKGRFGRQTVWTWGVYPKAQVFTGDFDRDGKWDVGLFDPLGDGRSFIQRGTGKGIFGGQYATSWVSSGLVFAGRFRKP
jgi:hypothetical protein